MKTDFFTTKISTLKGTRVSLVNQFKITLKDFLPELSDGMVITDRARGTTTTISKCLYAELRVYADDNQLQLGDVIEQLRQEIHRKLGAIKFTKGDRVKLTSKGIQLIPRMDMPLQRDNCLHTDGRTMDCRVLGRHRLPPVYRSRSVRAFR